MPPSPIITAALDEKRYADLCESMGLHVRPDTRFLRGSRNGKFYGVWKPAMRRIEVFYDIDEYDHNKLRFVNLELVLTLLHELRHAWQEQEHGPGWYRANVVAAEIDAEDFATKNVQKWRGVVKVKRRFPSSGFSKLSKTASSIRQTDHVG